MESGFWTQGVFHLLRWARAHVHLMTKGSAMLPCASAGSWREPQISPLRSGRDDNSYLGTDSSTQEKLLSPTKSQTAGMTKGRASLP